MLQLLKDSLWNGIVVLICLWVSLPPTPRRTSSWTKLVHWFLSSGSWVIQYGMDCFLHCTNIIQIVEFNCISRAFKISAAFTAIQVPLLLQPVFIRGSINLGMLLAANAYTAFDFTIKSFACLNGSDLYYTIEWWMPSFLPGAITWYNNINWTIRHAGLPMTTSLAKCIALL